MLRLRGAIFNQTEKRIQRYHGLFFLFRFSPDGTGTVRAKFLLRIETGPLCADQIEHYREETQA
jgi:hypothetical protein